jgi:two-component system NtrC family response regulator
LQPESDPPQVIIITGNGTIDTAITAIKLGAYDYIPKPYRMTEIDVMVRRAWEKRELLRATRLLFTQVAHRSVGGLGEIATESAAMLQAIAYVSASASLDEPVVLHGEPGVGKHELARYLHAHSGRPLDIFAELRGAVPDPEIGVQLFGREACGTGRRRQPGVLQRAERGTVAIDAALLDVSGRAALADAITQRSFSRIGGEALPRLPLLSRVVVCETEGAGYVPSDIGAIHITIPPLRARPEDIPELAAALVRDVTGGALQYVDAEAVALLQRYPWPGNVRELRAVLTRAGLLAHAAARKRRALTAADLRMVLIWSGGNPVASACRLDAPLADVERLHIEAVLARATWHQGRAAEALGISTKTLYRKMREYGICKPRRRTSTTLAEPQHS